MQPKGVSVYGKAASKTVNKITGAKTIIQPKLNTIRNRWVRQPQPIPSSVGTESMSWLILWGG